MTTAVATKPIKVGFVIVNFEMGGLEKVAALLANHLDREQFTPALICLGRNGNAARWLNEEIQVFELHKRSGNDLGVIRRLGRLLKSESFDLVHSHNWGTLVETLFARNWSRRTAHVHAEHGQELDALQAKSLRKRLRHWTQRLALSRVDQVVVCAEAVRKSVHQRCGFPSSNMLYLANGVPEPVSTSSFDIGTERQKRGIAESALVIGSVSRLAPVKDFGNGIEAVARLRRGGDDVHLVLVGDGPETDFLKSKAVQEGVSDAVHFTGRQDNVGDWLKLFDIYVNTSISEAMSMGILEAMAVGRPVVCTDVGDSALLLGEEPCGIAVPNRSPDRLAAAILELKSKERRKQLGQRAREEYLSRFSVAKMVEAYGGLYRQLIEKRG